MNDDVYDELSRFDDGFAPNFGFRPGPDVLPDGLVDLEVIDASPDRTQETKEAILRLCLRALSGPAAGTIFDQTYFMSRSESVARLGGDLFTLGLDTDKWKSPQRPFSVEIRKALPKLKGVRFRAKKETNWSEVKERYYHNIRVNQLLTKDTPLLPGGGTAPAAPATQQPQPRQQTPALAGVNGGGNTAPRQPSPPDDDGEIPF